MRTVIETFWEIILSLLGALAIAGLTILAAAVLACAAVAGCGWAFLNRKRFFPWPRRD